MAKFLSKLPIRGNFDGVCFYEWAGQAFARKASSLTRERVLKDGAFRRTRENASRLATASGIGSFVYNGLPKDFRSYWMFRAFTGEALKMLNKGLSEDEVKEKLWQTYVSVWEIKKQMARERGKLKVSKKGKNLRHRVIPRVAPAGRRQPEYANIKFASPAQHHRFSKRRRMIA